MPRSGTFEFTREIDNGEDYITICVEYSYTPGDPGRTWGRPEDCYPPEAGEVDIRKCFRTDTNEEVELTEAEFEKVEEYADSTETDDDYDPPDDDCYDDYDSDRAADAYENSLFRDPD